MKKLDELQLLKRGNIFKHGLLILGSLILLNSFLENNNIFVLNEKWSASLIVLVTVAICGIEMICFDIYPLTEKRQKLLIYFVGLFGVVSIIVSIFEMLNEQVSFIHNRQITDTGVGILFGGIFISITVAYIVKSYYNTKQKYEDIN
jgi:hypothetical protein